MMRILGSCVFACVALVNSHLPAQDRLAALEPLIGTWKCKTENAELESTFRWISDGKYIEHEHSLRMLGRLHEVKENIGWDGKSQSIRGWIFAPFGIARCSYRRDGDQWSLEAVLTRGDGSESTKKKTLVVEGDSLSIKNESAPLPELVTLEFKRQAKEN